VPLFFGWEGDEIAQTIERKSQPRGRDRNDAYFFHLVAHADRSRQSLQPEDSAESAYPMGTPVGTPDGSLSTTPSRLFSLEKRDCVNETQRRF